MDEQDEDAEEAPRTVVTTDDELRGYEIVKSIVSDVVDPARLVIRDNKKLSQKADELMGRGIRHELG